MKKQFLKNPLWITRAEMTDICKPCAEKMAKKGIAKVNLAVLDADLKLKTKMQEISDEQKSAASQLHPNEVAKCESKVDGLDGISDKSSFCSELIARIHLSDDEFFFEDRPEDVLFMLEKKNEKVKFQTVRLADINQDKEGKKFDVVLISEGLSTTGFMSNGLPAMFTEDFLSDPLTLAKFENAPARAYHLDGGLHHCPQDSCPPAGAILNEVGFYNNIHFGQYETPDGKQGRGVLGTFNVTKPQLQDHLKGCWEEEYFNPIEFSIDAELVVNIVEKDGSNVNVPVALENLFEVTLVNNSAADGYLISMAAGKQSKNKGKKMDREKIIALLSKLDPGKAKEITPETKDDVILSMLGELIQPEGKKEEKDSKDSVTIEALQAEVKKILDERDSSAEAQTLKIQASSILVKSKLDESKLPEAAKEKINAQFSGAVVEEKDLLSVIEAETKMFASFKDKGVNITGQEGHGVKVTATEFDKKKNSLYALMNSKATHEGSAAYRSLHHSYIDLAGLNNQDALSKESLARKIMAEMSFAMPSNTEQHDMNSDRILQGIKMGQGITVDARQGVLIPSDWSLALADVVTNTFLDIPPDPETEQWRMIAKVTTPAPDYKPQHFSRIPALDNLPVVPKGDPYQSWNIKTDEGASASIDTYGLKYKLHISTIVNDDIGAISVIPRRIKEAAGRTLWHKVTDPLLNNPVIFDGNNLFTNGAPHNNEGTLTFSPSNLEATSIAMQKQIEQGITYPLGARNKPRVLVIPTDLERQAWEAVKASMASFAGRDETLENWLQTQNITMAKVSHWTDTNDWVALADPQSIETLVVSFFENRQEPVILVQDSPTVGDMFNADVVTWRVHYLFLVLPVDYRGAYKQVVA